MHADGAQGCEDSDRLYQSSRDLHTYRRPQGNRGHSLGAAGAQEAIYCILMMNNGFICESANIQTLDPAFDEMPIVRNRRDDVKLGCVLSNSFGFGGTNACVVLKRLDA